MLLKNLQIFRTVPLTDVKFLPNFKPRHCFENKSANLKKNLTLFLLYTYNKPISADEDHVAYGFDEIAI